MRIKDALIVGVGGTGGYLVEPLTRLLTYHPNADGKVTVVDGDEYEDRNAERQVFPTEAIGRNKAEVTAERLLQMVPGAEVEALPSFLDPTACQGAIVNHRTRQQEGLPEVTATSPHTEPYLLVVSSVDNHATRKALVEAIDAAQMNVIFLSPGNGEDKGQVMSYVTFRGSPLQAHPFDRHPEIADPKDTMPGTCAEQAPTTPQLIGANMGAALVTLWAVQSWLDGRGLYDIVAFDTRTFVVKGCGNPLNLDGEPMFPESVTA